MYELAYGHHRIEALKQLEIKKLQVVVQPLTNDAMLQMMANENSEEYGHDFALGVMNAVEATVKAYAAGNIELEKPKRQIGGQGGLRLDQIRIAPSFCSPRELQDTEVRKVYTATTLAKYLGWHNVATKAEEGIQPQPRVLAALSALELIERKVLTRAQLRGLGVTQARDLITLCKRREAAEAEKLETQHAFLKEQAARAQKENDVNKLRSVEKKLFELEAEAPKAIAKAGKEAISAVKEFYDPEKGMAAALREAADKLKIDLPKAAAPKAPKVVDLSSVENFSAHLDAMLLFDDGRWKRILKLAEESKAKKPFQNLETSLLRLAQRIGERVKELRKVN